MLKFALTTIETTVDTSIENLLIDYEGYLIEVEILSKITALDGPPFFLTAFQLKKEKR